MEVMYVKKIENNYFKNKNLLSFIGEMEDLQTLVSTLEFYKFNDEKKVNKVIGKSNDYIKALGLSEEILYKKLNDLSGTDCKLIMLVKAIMLKPQIIILNNFELGINDRVNNRVLRFIKTINGAFNIKFIIISRNALYLDHICKDLIVMKNGIIKFQGDITFAIHQGYLPKPEIIKFIEKAKKKDKKIEETLDEKELLKAVYRSVK
jgi:ABC-type multidrug transport system ATPase subunit